MYLYNARQNASKNEALLLQDRLSKVIELPNEQPTLATVSDAAKLINQPFFSKAMNGDKVLIYSLSKKAILYRPSNGKIIEVGPVNINQPTVSPTLATASNSAQAKVKDTTPTPTGAAIRVALYNGTARTGLTKVAAEQLEKSPQKATVVKRTDAAKNDYKETIVIDVSGRMKQAADHFATIVKGKVAPLPKDETKPDADILIILGENYK
jgi:hypothetical protein